MGENDRTRGRIIRLEKQIASQLNGHPDMEKLMFEQVLEPHLTRLERLGINSVDIQKVYLELATVFLFNSSTQRALQTGRLERLYVDHKLSPKSNHEEQDRNGNSITLEPGIEHLIEV